MPSRFAARERRITAAIDREFAERTRITPRRRGEFITLSVDAERPVMIVVGIADFVPKAILPKDTSRFDGMQPMLGADASNISYDEDKLGTPASWPKTGDEIELIDRVPVLRFTVAADAESDGLGRIVCRILAST